LLARGTDVLVAACDVTDRAAAENLVEIARNRWGTIDVLINNAGVIQAAPWRK